MRSLTVGLRAVPSVAFGVLCAVCVGVWVAFPTWPSYDSQYALLWAGELLEGRAPGFDDYRAPTQHPLLLAVGLVLAPFGHDVSGRLLVALCLAALLALIVAMYRLGCQVAGVLGGVVAAGLVATRLDLGMLAAIGFLDVPYCALIAWAAALEVQQPRRGGSVWVLLALAGLLRPEAWLLGAAYALWVRRPRALLYAAVAPVLWMCVDLAATGDPLFSMRHTDALAAELGREVPLLEIPGSMVTQLVVVAKGPVIATAAVGAALGLIIKRRELALPGVLVALTCSSYLVIATGGLANVFRYLLVAVVGLLVFAAFALAGWTMLPRGTAGRAVWGAGALALFLAGAAYTVTHLSPAGLVSRLAEREAERSDLRAVTQARTVDAARRCGPVTVPNHKLIPTIRAILDLPSGAVRARSDRALGPQRRGVAIVIDRQIARRAAYDVREVGSDAPGFVKAPSGFRPLAGTSRFTAWGSCA